jgi:hypothetical protein
VLQDVPYEYFRNACIKILASVPMQILRSLAGSGVYRRAYHDEEFEKIVIDFEDRSDARPCIYTIEFIDKIGRPPSVGEMRRIVKIVRRYSSDRPTVQEAEEAVEIEGIINLLSDVEKQAI